jgi:hypothetical protein
MEIAVQRTRGGFSSEINQMVTLEIFTDYV